MSPDLQNRLVNRLVESGASDKPWALAIVAALEGEAHLAYLEGAKNVTAPVPRTIDGGELAVEPPGAYVASITLEDFRGIGPAAQRSR